MMMKIYHASGIALAGTSSPDHRRPSPDPRRDPSASETFVVRMMEPRSRRLTQPQKHARK